jgi:CheY-like chemotaxis protein
MLDDNDRYSIGAESLNGKTELIVDDERVIRHLLRRTLHREGFSVLTASDGVECLDRLRGAQVELLFRTL